MSLGWEIELNSNERKAREILNKLEWSPIAAVVAKVFRAMYACALPVEDIKQIGDAMGGGMLDPLILKEGLDHMVKIKVLRKRRHSGRTLYEVNY